MTTDKSNHGDCQRLIPWYVNGTLDEVDMVAIESHLKTCHQCRKDIENELNFSRQYVASNTQKQEQPHHMEAELNKLLLLLNKPTTRHHHKAVMATTFATLVIVFSASLFIAGQYWQSEDKQYVTLTNTLEKADGAVYQAIFEKNETPEDIRKILDAAGIRILSGPSPQGVYRITIPEEDGFRETIEFLKSHANLLVIEKEING